jgi:hypothetical protein
VQQRDLAIVMTGVIAQGFGLGVEGFGAVCDQWFQCFTQDQPDQFVGRVITAAGFTGEEVRANDQPFVGIVAEFEFQQTFVDRPQLLDRKIAVVDVTPLPIDTFKAEKIDYIGHYIVGNSCGGQEWSGIAIEKTTVISRQPD